MTRVFINGVAHTPSNLRYATNPRQLTTHTTLSRQQIKQYILSLPKSLRTPLAREIKWFRSQGRQERRTNDGKSSVAQELTKLINLHAKFHNHLKLDETPLVDTIHHEDENSPAESDLEASESNLLTSSL